MIRYIAVFTFLLIVGVCSYVVLNPGSYSTPVLLLASFCLVRGSLCNCASLENLSFSSRYNPSRATCRLGQPALTLHKHNARFSLTCVADSQLHSNSVTFGFVGTLTAICRTNVFQAPLKPPWWITIVEPVGEMKMII